MALRIQDYLYATVAYADIFDYPLTADDVYFWSIKKIPRKNFRSTRIAGTQKTHSLIFLRGRSEIISTYEARRICSKRKWELARTVGRWLRWIPTVYLVGVTGGLAMNNADKKDDIDLFFITARGTLWITRLLTIIAIDMLGVRRRPGSTRISDTICLNMFLSEDALSLPVDEQDIYAAHEVLQMEPLWSRRDTYKRFLLANRWVRTFLPVAWAVKEAGRNQHPKISHWWSRVARKVLRLFESPAKYLQLWYMAKHRTYEHITDGMLRFHPRDARIWIREKLSSRLLKRNIPLDNIFYCR